MSEARLQPVVVAGRCIGHVIRSARGAVAYDAKDAPIGTFSTAELAIDAISKRTAEAGKRELVLGTILDPNSRILPITSG